MRDRRPRAAPRSTGGGSGADVVLELADQQAGPSSEVGRWRERSVHECHPPDHAAWPLAHCAPISDGIWRMQIKIVLDCNDLDVMARLLVCRRPATPD